MIEAVKKFLTDQLTAVGLETIYTDASEAKRHKALPYASVLTPPERESEELSRTDSVEYKKFRDEDHPDEEARDTWLRVFKIFDRSLRLDAIISHKTEGQADELLTAFLTALPQVVYLDPDLADGYTIDRSQVTGLLNFKAKVEISGVVWSDSTAQIKNEAQANVQLIIHGAVLKAVVEPAMPDVTITAKLGEGEETLP